MPTVAHDFTAADPPPRRRPQGEPLPRYVELQPGEDPTERFREWDRAGRIPPDCTLARVAHDGYRVAAVPDALPKLRQRLKPGAAVPAAVLTASRHAAVIRLRPGPTWFVVLAPKGEPARA